MTCIYGHHLFFVSTIEVVNDDSDDDVDGTDNDWHVIKQPFHAPELLIVLPIINDVNQFKTICTRNPLCTLHYYSKIPSLIITLWEVDWKSWHEGTAVSCYLSYRVFHGWLLCLRLKPDLWPVMACTPCIMYAEESHWFMCSPKINMDEPTCAYKNQCKVAQNLGQLLSASLLC